MVLHFNDFGIPEGWFQEVFPLKKFGSYCFFGIPTHSAALFRNSDSLCSAFLEFLLTLQRFFGNPTHSAALFWKPYSLCSAFLEFLLTLQPFARKSDSICSALFPNPTHSAALWPSKPWGRPCFGGVALGAAKRNRVEAVMTAHGLADRIQGVERPPPGHAFGKHVATLFWNSYSLCSR